jgi:arylsulfatase A-like enzyme
MMASVDEGVGRCLDALRANGELDRTLILFLGDNGYFFGEHGWARAPLRVRRRIRSPFVLRYPPRVAAGTRSPIS